jgi:purine-binding chemotaxis protein CheW
VRAPPPPPVAEVRALLLPVRDEWYAVALAAVREVVEPDRLTPVPTAPPAVLGVLNVRGTVVPVLDTGVLLGLEPLAAAPAVAVVETALGPAGLATSAPPQVDRLGEDLGPSDLPAGTRRRRCGEGVATLLDVDAACAPERVV